MIARTKLTITEVQPIQAIGTKGAEKLSLKGKDEAGKELSYFTFSRHLFPLLKAGETIEVDVDTTQRQVGEAIYTDRKIAEIYIDGKPSGQGKPQGQWQRGSPEERASIESQTAFRGTCELMVAKVIDEQHPLAKAAMTWAKRRLGVEIPEVLPLTPEVKAAKPAQKAEVRATEPSTTGGETANPIDEIIARATEMKWTEEKLVTHLQAGGYKVAKLDELTALQAKMVLEWLKGKGKL